MTQSFRGASATRTYRRPYPSNTNRRSLCQYLIAAITLTTVTVGCSSSHTTGPASSSVTTTTTNTRTSTTTPHSPTGLTAEQLDAHLGIGVPEGWSLVDEGDARVWVPNDWVHETRGTCLDGSLAAGLIGIGVDPANNCPTGTPFPLPRQAVALIPLSQTRTQTGARLFDVHGYRVYKGSEPVGRIAFPWTNYIIPQLDVRIVTHGTLGIRILKTLAPSARSVALASANEAVTNNGHAIIEDGVSLSIPRSWVLTAVNDTCFLFVRDSKLLLVPAHLPVGSECFGPTGPAASPRVQNGLLVYETPHNIYGPNPSGRSIATLHHGPTTITIYDETGSPPTLDLFVRKSGSKITHVLTLGLGRDGRVAGGVLASVRAVT